MKAANAGLPFFVGLGVGVLLILGSFLMAFRGLAGARQVGRDLESQMEKLRWYYTLSPFPTAANIAMERESTRAIRAHYGELLAAASKGQLDEEARTPPIFMQQLGSTQKQLIQDAGPHADRLLPPDFTFGFDTYFVPGSPLPGTNEVSRLLIQLDVVRSVTRILFDEGIERLVEVKRETFDLPAQRKTEDVDPEAGVLKEDSTFARLHFTFVFEAREKALAAILNRLASHDLFIVVTSVQLEKKGDDVLSATTLKALPNAQPLSRMQRLLAGAEIETPSMVTLDIDVYRFNKGAPES